MRKAWAISATAAALLWGVCGPAAAFQEVPVPPAEDSAAAPSSGATAPAAAPVLDLQTKEVPAPKKSGSGLSLPSLGKLDFGLELLYGQQQQQPQLQDPQGSIADQTDDVKVLGTVRRRF